MSARSNWPAIRDRLCKLTGASPADLDSIDAQIEALCPHWTHIAESLPAYGERVLVTDGKEIGHVYRDKTDCDGEHFRFVDSDSWDEPDYFYEVTHWMPEPDLPNGERPTARGSAR